MKALRTSSVVVLVTALGFGFGFSSKGEEGGGAPGAAGTAPVAEAQLRAFEEKFSSEMREMGAVGAGLVVVRGSKILSSSYYGLADREKNIAASADTIWHWASVTKTLTAVRMMQLRDRGKLALSDAIVKYVP